jgi:hypothetical protein
MKGEIGLEIKNYADILVYANDLMLWTNSKKQLEDNLNQLNNI